MYVLLAYSSSLMGLRATEDSNPPLVNPGYAPGLFEMTK